MSRLAPDPALAARHAREFAFVVPLAPLLALALVIASNMGGCRGPQPAANENDNATNQNTANDNASTNDNSATADRIAPSDLEYLGAFRLPDRADGAPDAQSWEYGGMAFAFRPDGDPDESADGFPGSLFGTGHENASLVAELSIPAPSLARDVSVLNMATTLQSFADVSGGLFAPLVELPRVALEYLPAHGAQTTPKLYLAWGQHFQEDETTAIASHAWCEVDLAHPNTQGAWFVGDEALYATNGYLFTIPAEWANAHAPGRILATGRFRDGGWSGMGPSLIAIAPWDDGNPPAAGTHLGATALLRYSHTRGDDTTNVRLNGYHHSDEWEGGAWLTTTAGRSAVVFAGTKGSGYLWYGFYSPAHDGMPCVEQDLTMVGCFTPTGDECPAAMQADCPGHIAASRGWWSSRWDAQLIFYDPADFAAVAAGTAAPYSPQPYATLDIDEHLLLNCTVDTDSNGTGDQRRFRIGEIAYDREHGLLYVPERFADDAKPVMHVWRIAAE